MNQNLEREINQLHAQFCSGLADPKRLLIIYTLAEGPRNVSDLAETLKLSQPAVSRHLKVLRERGMVNANRVGAAVEYSLVDPRLVEALDILRAILASNIKSQAALIDNAAAENL